MATSSTAAFLTNYPGFPGFGPIVAKQTLAYTADMLESGVPVVYGYIGDLHEKKAGQTGCSTATATAKDGHWDPGDKCYLQTAQAYDAAFAHVLPTPCRVGHHRGQHTVRLQR
jgi:hypothetical protein